MLTEKKYKANKVTMSSEKLRKLRKNKNLTQKQLAEILGLSPYAIIQYENGNREPNFNAIVKICTFFEIPVQELVEDNNEYKDCILNSFDNVDFSEMKAPIIVIYDHPSDYPKLWVARIWNIDRPTNVVVINENLNTLRTLLPINMIMLNSSQKDDPCIKEIWL